MYIVFELLTLSDSAGRRSFFSIMEQVNAWSVQHDVKFKYKVTKEGLRIIFPNIEYYTLFGLTFEPKNQYAKKFYYHEPMARPDAQKN